MIKSFLNITKDTSFDEFICNENVRRTVVDKWTFIYPLFFNYMTEKQKNIFAYMIEMYSFEMLTNNDYTEKLKNKSTDSHNLELLIVPVLFGLACHIDYPLNIPYVIYCIVNLQTIDDTMTDEEIVISYVNLILEKINY